MKQNKINGQLYRQVFVNGKEENLPKKKGRYIFGYDKDVNTINFGISLILYDPKDDEETFTELIEDYDWYLQPFEPQEPNINTPFFGNTGAKIPMKPIINSNQPIGSTTDFIIEQKQTAEEILDLQQYVTNLLYTAYNEGVKLHIPYNTTKFDKWVEKQVELLKEYVQGQQPEMSDSDEDYRKHGRPT